MKAFDLDPAIRWLFCPTHPDDEMAMAAWIKRLVDNGNEVFINWTHHTPARKTEGHAVAKLLGVPEENLSFMDGTDGQIAFELVRLMPQFQELVNRVKPDRIACIAFEQGHLDHDATNYLVKKAFDGPIFEWPMYHPYSRKIMTMGRFADPTGEEVINLAPDEQRLKKQLSKSYPSQNIRSVLVWYHILCCLKLKPAALYKTERLRLQPSTGYLMPALDERKSREVEMTQTWQRWVEAVSKISEHV